jgi:hypothetical protein
MTLQHTTSSRACGLGGGEVGHGSRGWVQAKPYAHNASAINPALLSICADADRTVWSQHNVYSQARPGTTAREDGLQEVTFEYPVNNTDVRAAQGLAHLPYGTCAALALWLCGSVALWHMCCAGPHLAWGRTSCQRQDDAHEGGADEKERAAGCCPRVVQRKPCNPDA